MATLVSLLCSSYSSPSTFFHKDSISSSFRSVSTLNFGANDIRRCCLAKEMANLDFKIIETDEKFLEVHSIEEYEKGVQFSNEKLVIAHFSASTHCRYNTRIQQFMVEQSRKSNKVKFLNVMANESEKTRHLCRRENIERIPHFIFYKNAEKIHEAVGFQQERLVSNILYYKDDPFSSVVQLNNGDELEKLIHTHDKLIVVNVGKRECVPCVKIYPSVVKLADQMAGRVVFARMNADENESCMEMLKEMNVSKVPAFLFFRNGEFCGKYVGSCTSMLIRKMVKLANQSYSKYIPENK
ncbi:hypothetical protein BUALT_Bualt15G0005400 [Buddleja alternifolia]|uniref:Thioredoxin domain-containing protein n=1 Tax=Buddleja alternifolia TaxID=168488 RepID=A0AAV6WBK1_9LAMI|nr:hypothetical protein BUALT_Bualt15G0005400 [Buddleja alternifolia]